MPFKVSEKFTAEFKQLTKSRLIKYNSCIPMVKQVSHTKEMIAGFTHAWLTIKLPLLDYYYD